MFCIFSLIKNERPHLEEWIKYHLDLGVDRIVLIEDRGSESHKDIADKYDIELYSIKDILEPKDYKHSFRQKFIIRWFRNRYCLENDIDWAILLDIDEYLVFDIPISEFCERFKYCSAVHLYWKCYNANGHYKIDPGTQQELYKNESAIVDAGIHFNSKYVINIKIRGGRPGNLHYYVDGFNTRCEMVDPKTFESVYDYAYIDHFICRSYEDWLYKLKYRKNLNLKKNDDTFWILNPDMDKETAKEQYGLYYKK